MEILTTFFQGENAYLQADGSLARNKLKKDYDKWLYQRGVPREYSVAELEAAAKAYRGPAAKESAKTDAEFARKLRHAVSQG